MHLTFSSLLDIVCWVQEALNTEQSSNEIIPITDILVSTIQMVHYLNAWSLFVPMQLIIGQIVAIQINIGITDSF